MFSALICGSTKSENEEHRNKKIINLFYQTLTLIFAPDPRSYLENQSLRPVLYEINKNSELLWKDEVKFSELKHKSYYLLEFKNQIARQR